MNITEFRKQYPQYDDIGDTALASALHARYYSDVPIMDFMEKFGVRENPAEPDPWTDPVSALSGVAGIARKLGSTATAKAIAAALATEPIQGGVVDAVDSAIAGSPSAVRGLVDTAMALGSGVAADKAFRSVGGLLRHPWRVTSATPIDDVLGLPAGPSQHLPIDGREPLKALPAGSPENIKLPAGTQDFQFSSFDKLPDVGPMPNEYMNSIQKEMYIPKAQDDVVDASVIRDYESGNIKTERELLQDYYGDYQKDYGGVLDVVRGRLDGAKLRGDYPDAYRALVKTHGPGLFRSGARGGSSIDELAQELQGGGLLRVDQGGDDLLMELIRLGDMKKNGGFYGGVF